jgi:glycerophosphoryl diester phosphodiesterase
VGSWFNDAYPDRARAGYVGLAVPTLEELFTRYGRRARYYIETKTPEAAPGMEARLLALLERHQLRPATTPPGQLLVQSFSRASLRALHARDPSLPLVQLFGGPEATSAGVRARLADVARYAVAIGPPSGAVDAALVEAAHARCLAVHPYTVNETAEMQALVAAGVDGMFTNFPDRLAAVLQGNTSPRPARCRVAAACTTWRLAPRVTRRC